MAVPLSVHAGFFTSLFGTTEVVELPTANQTFSQNAATVALLSAIQNPNPSANRGGAEIVVEDGALVATGPVTEDEIANQDFGSSEIRVYTVREGDTISQIAEIFNVTINTIRWANDLSRTELIQPGDSLIILPVAGVRHVVKDGDTLGTIAKKYDGDTDEILQFNGLTTADELAIGETLIIPGGDLHSAAPSRVAQAAPVKVSGVSAASGGGFIHPAPGSVRTQGIHGYNAVDLAAAHGASIRAAAAGEVIVAKPAGWNGGYGSYVVIRHSNGTQTLYAHLSGLYVGVGSYVGQGDVIGAMGSTGRSTGTHLHFEVRGGYNPF